MKSWLDRSDHVLAHNFFRSHAVRLLGGNNPATAWAEARELIISRFSIAEKSRLWPHIQYRLDRDNDEFDLQDDEWLRVAGRVMTRVGAEHAIWWAFLQEAQQERVVKGHRARLWITALLVKPDGKRIPVTPEFFCALNSDGSKLRGAYDRQDSAQR